MKNLFQVKVAAAAVSLLLATAGASMAGPITTLFSTGVDASGAPLGNNAAEVHYILAAVPSGTTAVRVATDANGFPLPPWLNDAASSTSRWIGLNSDTELNGPVGNYDYRTTFDLTGFNIATVNIGGKWSVDNSGVDILLNGVSLGIANNNGFQQFTAFSIAGLFVQSINTIDFIINNAGGPTGMRVEIAGTADAMAVPEPATLALLGMGLLGLGFSRRKQG